MKMHRLTRGSRKMTATACVTHTIVAMSGEQVPNIAPGNTDENILATVIIPGGSLGPNGFLDVASLWSVTNNNQGKTLRVRLGGLTGAIVSSFTSTFSVTARMVGSMSNRGSVNSQILQPRDFSGAGESIYAVSTANIDTSVNQNLVFTAELQDGADTATMESYWVRISRA